MDLSPSASNPYFNTEKQKQEHITIPTVITCITKPSFRTKPKRNRKIVSVPIFKTETESDSDIFPMLFKVYS